MQWPGLPSRVLDWRASIDTNEASAVSARKAGPPADELHAVDYMVHICLRTGQDEAARKLVLESAESPFVPAREMLGELLLDASQPAQTLKDFKATLVKQPNRFWSVYGAALAAQRSGGEAAARLYFQQLLSIARRADEPRREALTTAHQAVKAEGVAR